MPKNTLAGRRVLIVEDEAMIAMMIEDMLAEIGCEIVGPASHIAEALRVIESEDFDAAVLDVNVNGLQIFPVAAALRSKGVPFVFATGYGASGISSEYSDEPVLQKPFKQEQLENALDRVLGGQHFG
jgi:two-component SAPR family response regulator